MTHGRTLTVLVVDDDELTRKSLRRILELDDYLVEVAASAADCVEKVRRVDPFAILLDRKLEDGTAEGVLPQLRELAPHANVVIATGFADLESSIEALRLGAADYLVKPINPELLQGCLRRLRREYETKQELLAVQEELRVQAERLQMAASAARDAIWDCDLVAGTVWWNERYERMFGTRPPETNRSDESWFEQIHPDDRESIRASFTGAIASDATEWEGDYRYQRADGTWADVVDQTCIARDVSGRAVRILSAMSNVTDRKRLEKEFLQSQKMEAVGRLAGGVAHDFNNLLAGVVSCCRVASRMFEGGAAEQKTEALELLAAMQKKAMRGASMTRQLLDFSRIRLRKKERVDVIRTVAEAEELLPRLLGEDIEVTVLSTAVEATIDADEGLFEQVVMNLAVNARDAMPNGGKLGIRVSTVAFDEATAPGELSAGEHVLLEVTDTGCGMSEETKRKAFDPFFTTKPRGKGTGLGLATVFGLVHDFAGHIELESAVGMGTTFKLYFPRRDHAASKREGPVDEQAQQSLDEGTILLVEDESLIRAATKMQLVDLGYTVHAAAAPREALELLAREGLAIDLLLSDIVMPGMNGPELARRLLAQNPDMRVLFMSGFSDEALVEQGRVEAGVPILEKPFEEEELVARVRESLARTKEPRP